MINRRDFVVATGGSAVALALASCTKEETSPPAVKSADADPSASASAPASAPAPRPADVLARESLLEFLDARADSNMARCQHCAQASFLTLQEGFGLPGGTILKALTPLPGIAERGETCGAVIGSLMALGLVFGRDQLGDSTAWRAALVPARTFCARFEEELGSTQCGDLLEKHFGKRYDLADPSERAEYLAARPGPTEICGRVVRTAVRLATIVILENRAAQ